MVETKCKYSVTDPERSARILERLENFSKANRFCNVDIQNKSFSTNATLLAVCYDYFEESLIGNSKDIMLKMKECYEKVSPAVIEALVTYFSDKKLDINEDNIYDMLSTTSVLNLTEIFHECLKFLEKNLRPDNCIRSMQLAKKYLDENLQRKAFLYVVEHFSNVRHQEGFLKLDQDEMYELLKCDDLNVTSEKVVFESLKMWTLYDITNRTPHLKNLLHLVKLPQLPIQYLFEAVSPFVHFNSDCNRDLNEALHWHVLLKENSDLRSNWIKPRKSTHVLLAVGDWHLETSRIVDAYDPTTKVWSRYMNLNINKQRFGSALVDNKLLTFGGDTGKELLNTVDLIDLKTKSMTSLSPLKHARSGPAVVELDNFIYAIGGMNLASSEVFNSVEKWDPKTQLWYELAPMKTSRMGFGAVSMKGKIYVVGGGSFSNAYSSVEIYDPTTDTWEFGVPMNEKRIWISVVAVKDSMFVFGGDDLVRTAGDIRLITAERFDFNLNKWTYIANLIQGGDGIGAYALSNKIICVGGYDKGTYHHVQEYDTEKNTWKFLAPLVTQRAHVHVLPISRDAIGF